MICKDSKAGKKYPLRGYKCEKGKFWEALFYFNFTMSAYCTLLAKSMEVILHCLVGTFNLH